MFKQPLISVITVTFNASATLPITMKSVANQTFSDFEHIIVDGASRDDTIMVARQMGRKDVKIVSEPDDGLYDAMNKGLRIARGQYVLFLNAGDAFHDPDTLQYYATAINTKNADIIFGDTNIVGVDGRLIGPRHLSVPDILTVDSFSDGMLICHQSFMVRKSIAPRFDTDYRFSADYDWTIRCIKSSRPGRRINLHRVVTDYLSDGLSDSNKRNSLKERFAIMASHYGAMRALWKHVTFIPRALRRGKL